LRPARDSINNFFGDIAWNLFTTFQPGDDWNYWDWEVFGQLDHIFRHVRDEYDLDQIFNILSITDPLDIDKAANIINYGFSNALNVFNAFAIANTSDAWPNAADYLAGEVGFANAGQFRDTLNGNLAEIGIRLHGIIHTVASSVGDWTSPFTVFGDVDEGDLEDAYDILVAISILARNAYDAIELAVPSTRTYELIMEGIRAARRAIAFIDAFENEYEMSIADDLLELEEDLFDYDDVEDAIRAFAAAWANAEVLSATEKAAVALRLETTVEAIDAKIAALLDRLGWLAATDLMDAETFIELFGDILGYVAEDLEWAEDEVRAALAAEAILDEDAKGNQTVIDILDKAAELLAEWLALEVEEAQLALAERLIGTRLTTLVGTMSIEASRDLAEIGRIRTAFNQIRRNMVPADVTDANAAIILNNLIFGFEYEDADGDPETAFGLAAFLGLTTLSSDALVAALTLSADFTLANALDVIVEAFDFVIEHFDIMTSAGAVMTGVNNVTAVVEGTLDAVVSGLDSVDALVALLGFQAQINAVRTAYQAGWPNWSGEGNNTDRDELIDVLYAMAYGLRNKPLGSSSAPNFGKTNGNSNFNEFLNLLEIKVATETGLALGGILSDTAFNEAQGNDGEFVYVVWDAINDVVGTRARLMTELDRIANELLGESGVTYELVTKWVSNPAGGISDVDIDNPGPEPGQDDLVIEVTFRVKITGIDGPDADDSFDIVVAGIKVTADKVIADTPAP
jgi:hypothetical protein